MASHSVWFVALGRIRLVWLSQALAIGLEVRGRSQFGGMVETRRNSGLGEELYYQTKSQSQDSVAWLEPGWDVRATLRGGRLAVCRIMRTLRVPPCCGPEAGGEGRWGP